MVIREKNPVKRVRVTSGSPVKNVYLIQEVVDMVILIVRSTKRARNVRKQHAVAENTITMAEDQNKENVYEQI